MKYSPASPSRILSYRETFRLVSMVMMLGLIGTTIYMNRREARLDKSPIAVKSEQPFQETVMPGANDTQPFEESDAQRVFQAITDKAELSREEMAAYWKLYRWARTQSFEGLKERADTSCYYTHLAQSPDKYRGKLVALDVSLRRSAEFESKENPVSAKQIFEAWGVTDESRGNFYCFVFIDKPPELPIHHDIHEEAEFVGYFLKHMTYKDPLDKIRYAPLLIGRLRWKENAARVGLTTMKRTGDYWTWGMIVAVMLIGLGTHWYLRPPVLESEPPSTSPEQLEDWLSGASGSPTTPANLPLESVESVISAHSQSPVDPSSPDTPSSPQR